MFTKTKSAVNGPIDTLIGANTVIEGHLRFRGGARIDGKVKGSVTAEEGQPSMLVLSESGRIEGPVRVAQLVINGRIEGAIQADELIDLQPKAHVVGDVRYKALEMHHGAVIEGTLTHLESARPGLKLAVSRDA